MAKITLDNLAHSYLPNPTSEDDFALKELNHDWVDGEAYALLGASGCGKSTLLNIISGLLHLLEMGLASSLLKIAWEACGRSGYRPRPSGGPARRPCALAAPALTPRPTVPPACPPASPTHAAEVERRPF